MSNGSLSSSTPVARLCHIIQWKHFDGYGFNLHAEKGKPGQYIGKVDEGSPAEAAGLKQGDRIVEVNGVNISNENHKQVVQRIKAISNQTKLLVVDSEADKYYKANNIIITSSLPDVAHLQTPMPNEDGEVDMNGEKTDGNCEDSSSHKSERSGASAEPEAQPEKLSYKSSSTGTTPSSERKHDMDYSPEPQVDSADEGLSSVETSLRPPSSNGSSNDGLDINNRNSSLNLNMTAKELRAQLASRKKYDPKKESMDFKKKFDIVQKL
ncbi:Na(+)/H(+) exchange regulatory cofactor NHE-RF2 [Periplaneta americana]|uniref:Na(+)/H(+) exchange regulatory cofactor NHE-RF2 n=1 Tax=Periplaneta americana TaxID=6978 RepID=UPI0037E82FF0